ncbi:MAG: Na+/H+ antiporter NhaC family protein [Puniceicoccaceae bacterium]
MGLIRSVPFWFFVAALVLSWGAGQFSRTVFVVEAVALDKESAAAILGERGEGAFAPVDESVLWPLRGSPLEVLPEIETESIVVEPTDPERPRRYYELNVVSHRGIWSLFPAFVTIVLCFLTREPVTALLGGIISGALVLGAYDVTGQVLRPGLANTDAALILVLYLLFLGGLLGLWSRNGGALAFADWVTRRLVRGPRTAKLSAWFLGVFFFQGGTISSLLVGTTVKPIADREKVSHEELSYIVDSTASPIAILLPFNAWPLYVQALLFVGGVAALATEANRIEFFFSSVYLSFYAILAVFFTFLLSIDKLPFIGRTFREAVRRSRETGELDRPGAAPLQSSETNETKVPEGYRPAAFEFFLPVLLIVGIAVGTYLFLDSPNVLWAFGIALAASFFISRVRGMPLAELMKGFQSGLQSVVYGAVVLLLAVVIGGLSRETGGGLFLVEAVGERVPVWILPILLFLISLGIAFATGTSWGTFAVTFPLAMPLAWAVAQNSGMAEPVFFLQICFATILNGSVFGDQCSPISDTSVLSSLATGCDLMDHIRTQIVPCVVAGGLALTGWTVLSVFAAR